VTVTETNVASATGSLFVPQTPESYTYDADGNLLKDGRWNYTWDLAREIDLPGVCSGTAVGHPAGLVPYDQTLKRIFLANHNPSGWGGLSATPWFLSLGVHAAAEK
jgi:hypothetical protein